MEAASFLQSVQDVVDVHAPSALLSTPFKNILSLLGALILKTHLYLT